MNKLTDYGLVIMAHFAKSSAQALNTAEVAEATQIPVPTVSKILKSLSQHGLLVSQRGAKGGYQLRRAASAISLVEVIEALEGPIAMTECSSDSASCQLESKCGIRKASRRINNIVRNALKDVSLAQMNAG